MKHPRDIVTEVRQCFCQNCRSAFADTIVYHNPPMNHGLHIILTLVTGLWIFMYAYFLLFGYRKTIDENRRKAAFELTCPECQKQGGVLLIEGSRSIF